MRLIPVSSVDKVFANLKMRFADTEVFARLFAKGTVSFTAFATPEEDSFCIATVQYRFEKDYMDLLWYEVTEEEDGHYELTAKVGKQYFDFGNIDLFNIVK